MARPSGRTPTGLRRLPAAWSGLTAEQRTVFVTALVLLLTMLLPWYDRTVTASVNDTLPTTSQGKPAIVVFSFVEAALFLVAVGVMVLMFARGERKTFGLPGGDGTIVTIAGGWATFLIFFRFVDHPDADSPKNFVVTYELSWGIFFGLIAALALLASGLRLRGAGGSLGTAGLRRGPSDAGLSPGARRARQPAAPASSPGSSQDWRTEVGKGSEAEREARRRARAREREEQGKPGWLPPPGWDEEDDAPPARPRPSRDQAHTVVDPRPDPSGEPTRSSEGERPSPSGEQTRSSEGERPDPSAEPTRHARGERPVSDPSPELDPAAGGGWGYPDEATEARRQAPEPERDLPAPEERTSRFEPPEFLLPRRTPREPPAGSGSDAPAGAAASDAPAAPGPPAASAGPAEDEPAPRRPRGSDDDAQLSFE